MRAFILVLLLLGACASPRARPADIVSEMRALEAARGAAIRSGDAAALQRIYAPDFTGVTASGASVTREQLFAAFARARANAPQVVEASTSQVLSAKREGDVIVVTGRLHFGDGDSVYTHVFRRRGGRWELFAAAASPLGALS